MERRDKQGGTMDSGGLASNAAPATPQAEPSAEHPPAAPGKQPCLAWKSETLSDKATGVIGVVFTASFIGFAVCARPRPTVPFALG